MAVSHKKSNQWKRTGKNGSICLETAVTLPIVLLLTAQFISLIMMSRAEIILECALDRTAAELSLLSPLCGGLKEWQTAAGTDLHTDRADTGQLSDLFSSLWPDADLSAIMKDAALDLASTMLLGRLVQDRLDKWLADTYGGRANVPACFHGRRIYLDWKLSENQLWLCLSWQYMTPMGPARRFSMALVPLWTGKPEESAAQNANCVWDMDNFHRGTTLRRIFGANLPYDFPVIAAMHETEAISIKSMDLTAPTYSSAARVRSAIDGYIDDLAAFSQAQYHKNSLDIDIEPDRVKTRRLLLIIPENSSRSWQEEVFDLMGSTASGRGVDLQIIRYGKSEKYLSQDRTAD